MELCSRQVLTERRNADRNFCTLRLFEERRWSTAECGRARATTTAGTSGSPPSSSPSSSSSCTTRSTTFSGPFTRLSLILPTELDSSTGCRLPPPLSPRRQVEIIWTSKIPPPPSPRKVSDIAKPCQIYVKQRSCADVNSRSIISLRVGAGLKGTEGLGQHLGLKIGTSSGFWTFKISLHWSVPITIFCLVKVKTSVPDPWNFGVVWIRIRGSMPLTSGSGSGSCYFCHWPSRCQQKTNF